MLGLFMVERYGRKRARYVASWRRYEEESRRCRAAEVQRTAALMQDKEACLGAWRAVRRVQCRGVVVVLVKVLVKVEVTACRDGGR